eukprot:1006293-Pyramimonas_sp.AAC.1
MYKCAMVNVQMRHHDPSRRQGTFLLACATSICLTHERARPASSTTGTSVCLTHERARPASGTTGTSVCLTHERARPAS